MRKYGNKRDISEKDIVAALRKAGASVYLMDKPTDGLIGYKGKTYIGEFKDPKKKGWKSEFTPDQIDFIKSWRGSPVVVLRSVDDALRFLGVAE